MTWVRVTEVDEGQSEGESAWLLKKGFGYDCEEWILIFDTQLCNLLAFDGAMNHIISRSDTQGSHTLVSKVS